MYDTTCQESDQIPHRALIEVCISFGLPPNYNADYVAVRFAEYVPNLTSRHKTTPFSKNMALTYVIKNTELGVAFCSGGGYDHHDKNQIILASP